MPDPVGRQVRADALPRPRRAPSLSAAAGPGDPGAAGPRYDNHPRV